jgi:hypothetical protein
MGMGLKRFVLVGAIALFAVSGVAVTAFAHANCDKSGNNYYGDEHDNDCDANDNNSDMFGYQGDDKLAGGGGIDNIFGGTGSDVLRGQGGNDYLFGQANADVIYDGPGNDYIDGGPAEDALFYCSDGNGDQGDAHSIEYMENIGPC